MDKIFKSLETYLFHLRNQDLSSTKIYDLNEILGIKTSESLGMNLDCETPQEQLVFPFYIAKGLPSLRLLEPIESLRLTPFTLKAARATDAKTVGELSDVISNTHHNGKRLGQGHIEEITEKIASFLGPSPSLLDDRVDWESLLRLMLQPCDPKDVAVVIITLKLEPIYSLSPQETREAESFCSKDKERRVQTAFLKIREKASSLAFSLLNLVYIHVVEPWIRKRGGVIHEQELSLFLFEKGTISSFSLYEKIISLFGFFVKNMQIFHRWMHNVTGGTWAISAQTKEWAKVVIEDARTLSNNHKGNIRSLAQATGACRVFHWDNCQLSLIERLLFWEFNSPRAQLREVY